MKLLITKGTTNVTLLVFIQDSSLTTGAGNTGLLATNITAYFSRVEDDNDVIQIALRRLRIAVATTASWRLMEMNEKEESVVKYIQDTGFALDPYVDGRILQAKH